MEQNLKPIKHLGSCHCGDVRFEATVDATAASRCNCTVCTKVGMTAALIKPDAFKLLSEPSNLSEYVWGSKIGKRFFCKRCGVHCFGTGHLEMLGGDFVSINFNCLDDIDLGDVKLTFWDGRNNNWQAGKRDKPWPIASA